ncbi:unnamed protein product [Brugia timori]|uniref:ShKT domain-containing protein n=1 Tax=Brugia timori TaxID=42155 RepID=A0A0R3Q428_9BILA|nr:unnamed protein product [Brugia timori]
MRYSQQGNFLPSPILRTQQSRKSWQNKIGVQQKHKNYQQNGNGKLYNYECRDFEPFCEHWARNVGCYSKHRNFMMKRCPKTCNTCYPFFSAVNQGDAHPVNCVISVRSCIDNNRNCNLWAQHGECYGSRKAYMAANCRFSCALCTPSSYYERKYQRRRRNWNSLLSSDSILLPSTSNNFGLMRMRVGKKFSSPSESILRYEATLQLLKDELEKNYEEYQWNNPQFCKAYLAVSAVHDVANKVKNATKYGFYALKKCMKCKDK